MSVLQTFTPRPDGEISAILDNVSDGIRMGASDLLVHEVGTLLSAVLRLERSKPQHQRAKHTSKPLLDALTRHLVTFHGTAPINDVCRAAAFLTKVTSAHGRVVLHEIECRVAKEASNLTVPPVAALDLIAACAHLEPEDAHGVVAFPRNLDLDDDLVAPASLSLPSRPVARRVMLATACDTLLTHAGIMSADDVADALMSLRHASFQHDALLDRLVARAMHVVDSTSSLSILRILEGIMFFKMRDAGLLFEKYAARICRGGSGGGGGAGGSSTSSSTGSRAAASGNAGNIKPLTLGQAVVVMTAYLDAGEMHTALFSHIVDAVIGRADLSSGRGVTDQTLVNLLDIVERTHLYRSGHGGSVAAIARIVDELFVVRGGLSPSAAALIESTQRTVETLLPFAESNAALLDAIQPLVKE